MSSKKAKVQLFQHYKNLKFPEVKNWHDLHDKIGKMNSNSFGLMHELVHREIHGKNKLYYPHDFPRVEEPKHEIVRSKILNHMTSPHHLAAWLRKQEGGSFSSIAKSAWNAGKSAVKTAGKYAKSAAKAALGYGKKSVEWFAKHPDEVAKLVDSVAGIVAISQGNPAPEKAQASSGGSKRIQNFDLLDTSDEEDDEPAPKKKKKFPNPPPPPPPQKKIPPPPPPQKKKKFPNPPPPPPKGRGLGSIFCSGRYQFYNDHHSHLHENTTDYYLRL